MRNIKSTTLQQPLSEDALFIVFQQEFFKLKPEDCLKLKLRLYFTFATLLVITNKCQSYIYPEEPRIIKLSMTENCTTRLGACLMSAIMAVVSIIKTIEDGAITFHLLSHKITLLLSWLMIV